MPKLLSVVCLAVVLPSVAHAQFGYDDFIRNVEAGGNAGSGASPRVAQTAAQESSLPAPAAVPAAAQPTQVPSLTAPQAASSQPAASPPAQAVPQPVPMMQSPVPMTHSAPVSAGVNSNVVNFDQLFADEQYGLSTSSGCGCDQTAAPAGRCNSGCRTCSTGQCAAMAYYTPQLPPPSTLRGYFNASPCVANLWDNYACEAGKECAKLQQRVAAPQCGTCGH